MDIMKFVDFMYKIIKEANPETRLRTHRINCGMSQSELSKISGVPLLQIQIFEQRKRNINKTAAETLLRLSKALCCTMEDLIEKERNEYEQ